MRFYEDVTCRVKLWWYNVQAEGVSRRFELEALTNIFMNNGEAICCKEAQAVFQNVELHERGPRP